MWPLWLVEMSLQHIQKNSPRLLPKPAKFEKNPPNGYRVIRKTKRGAAGAWRSPIHKQASLVGRLIIAYTHSMIWPSNGHIPELEPLNVHIPHLCTCKIRTKKVWISSFHLKEGAQGLTLTLCFSTGWFEALPKVGEWVIWEKLAICNTSRDNSHIVIFSRRVISYGSETSLCEGPCKSRWMSYLRKNWLSAILFRDNSHLLILSRWVISYGCETSPSESSPKSRWMSYLRKIGYLQYF